MKKTALFGLVILVLLVVAMSQIPAFKSTPSPAATFDEALAKFETLRREDSLHPLRPEGASRLFHHEHKTERVFVLLHGLTNCPEQFVPLAKILHAKGANVVLPRARLAGFADRLNNDQGHQTAQDLIDQATVGLDIAGGLGDRITLIGLSGSAVAVGWMAQNREGIDDVMLISPFFGMYGVKPSVIDATAATLSKLPNFYQWWDASKKDNLPGPLYAYPRFGTHCMADTIQLSRDVRTNLGSRPLFAKRLIFLTTASDRGANNQLTNEIASQLKAREGEKVITYEFPEFLGIPHDMIDPAQPGAKTDLSYSKILELVEM
jgi:pimeloyl-ACP methyl ester carboxylesterase